LSLPGRGHQSPKEGLCSGHDHNYRATLAHIAADALTSLLAILALVAGARLGWWWLDALSGVVGGAIVLKWSAGLCRSAALELLDVEPGAMLQHEIRGALEAFAGVSVSDLHVWHLGQGERSCVATIVGGGSAGHLRVSERLGQVWSCPSHD